MQPMYSFVRNTLVLLVTLPGIAMAQRVVDPNSPWNVERQGTRMNRPLRTATPIQAGEFVRRTGSVLTLAGKPFRFNGNNVYYNQADIVYGRQAMVEESLDKMAAVGMNVVRSNAHNDNVQTSDPAAIQLQPGVYSEASLVALDRSIALAKARNLRLILKLTNNWTAYGGIQRYVSWHLNRTPTAQETGLFYSNETIKTWFKNYIKMLIGRTNTVTGVSYREEPAILAWELGNELRNPSVGGADALVAWTAEMAAFIKQLDSNHLVADGGEGFDDSPALYAGMSNRYAVGGTEGCSYHRLVAIPELDMVSYHLYPSNWGMNDGNDTSIYIRRHEEMAREAGKVAYLGEYGKRLNNQSPAACNSAPGRGFDPQRAVVFQSWIDFSALEQASSGVMVWQLINDGKNDCEGFQVYCPQDMQSCEVLRKTSERVVEQSPVVTSAATYKAISVAAGSVASLFGGGLSDLRIALVDGKGKSYDTQIFFTSAGQINFLVPDAVPVGGAAVRVTRDGATVMSTPLMIASVEPGLFTAAGDGQGLAAAVAVIVGKDGSQRSQFIARYDEPRAKFVAIPIAIPSDGVVVLSLFGTGIKGHGDLSKVSATVNGVAAQVLYAGAQGEFAGLDQVNVQVPAATKGAGEVDVVLTVAGKAANVVRAAFVD